MRFIDKIVEVLVVLPRLVALIRSKQTVFPRHSLSHVRHISPFPAASTGPLPSKFHEVCTANPRPILAATGARALESTENLGAPLVQHIALIVDVTVCGNTKYEPSSQYRRRKKLLSFGFSFQK